MGNILGHTTEVALFFVTLHGTFCDGSERSQSRSDAGSLKMAVSAGAIFGAFAIFG
jgi:hypothetical protein